MMEKKNLRIAFLKRSFSVHGGLEKYCLRLAEFLRKEGHHVDILSSIDNVEKGIRCISSPIKPTLFHALLFTRRCKKYVSKNTYDCVVGFDRHTIPLTVYRAGNGCHKAYLRRRFKEASLLKKILLLLNPLHIWTLYSEWYTFVHKPPRALLCNSHLVANEIKKEYPNASMESCRVIHNGVEWSFFENFFVNRESRSSDSPVRLLIVGNQWYRKGLDIVLKALSMLSDEAFHLTVIGKEKKWRIFQKMAFKLGLKSKVSFIPQTTAVVPFLQKNDILLVPSRYDPFANVTVEGLAMGLFVITSTANGGSECVAEGSSGYVVPEGSSTEIWAKAIKDGCVHIRENNAPDLIRKSVQFLDFETSLQSYGEVINAPPRHSDSR